MPESEVQDDSVIYAFILNVVQAWKQETSIAYYSHLLGDDSEEIRPKEEVC